jgi:hypothetical protein
MHGGKATNDQINSQQMAALLRGGLPPQTDVSPAPMRATRDLLMWDQGFVLRLDQYSKDAHHLETQTSRHGLGAPLVDQDHVCLALHCLGNRCGFAVISLAVQGTHDHLVLHWSGDNLLQCLDFCSARQRWVIPNELLINRIRNEHSLIEVLEKLQVPGHGQTDKR